MTQDPTNVKNTNTSKAAHMLQLYLYQQLPQNLNFVTSYILPKNDFKYIKIEGEEKISTQGQISEVYE